MAEVFLALLLFIYGGFSTIFGLAEMRSVFLPVVAFVGGLLWLVWIVVSPTPAWPDEAPAKHVLTLEIYDG